MQMAQVGRGWRRAGCRRDGAASGGLTGRARVSSPLGPPAGGEEGAPHPIDDVLRIAEQGATADPDDPPTVRGEVVAPADVAVVLCLIGAVLLAVVLIIHAITSVQQVASGEVGPVAVVPVTVEFSFGESSRRQQ